MSRSIGHRDAGHVGLRSVAALLAAGGLMISTAAQAADPFVTPPATGWAAGLDPRTLTAASVTVLTLFLIAVLLESALALLFNWRPFVESFNARATRPLVAFAVAGILVFTFGFDAITKLMNAINGTTDAPGPLGLILTAAILAGGSAGVNTLMVALGFREVRTPATEAPKPPPQLAWIAVRIIETKAPGGDYEVHIGEPAAADVVPLAGVISVTGSGSDSAIRRFFLRDRNRFPPFAGHVVPSGHPCRVYLSRVKAGQAAPEILFDRQFVPAQGAVIDFVVKASDLVALPQPPGGGGAAGATGATGATGGATGSTGSS